MKASSLALDGNTSILMKAPAGFGKTIAASSFCLGGDIFIAYFDKKKPVELIHFYRNVIKRPELLNKIEFEIYGANNFHEYMNKVISLSQDCRYHAVITDSLTQLTSSAVNWSLAFRDPKGGKKDKLNKDAPALIPDWDEYKVETSAATQVLDLFKTMPTNVIWTAHPLPTVKIEGSGNSVKVTKANSLVTYGSKVAGIVPGNFTEIYHFSKRSDWDALNGKSITRYLVDTEAVGDEFAKSSLGLSGELDITNRLFYEVWKEKLKSLQEVPNEASLINSTSEVGNDIDKLFEKSETPTVQKYPW